MTDYDNIVDFNKAQARLTTAARKSYASISAEVILLYVSLQPYQLSLHLMVNYFKITNLISLEYLDIYKLTTAGGILPEQLLCL